MLEKGCKAEAQFDTLVEDNVDGRSRPHPIILDGNWKSLYWGTHVCYVNLPAKDLHTQALMIVHTVD